MLKKVLIFCSFSLLIVACTPNIKYNLDSSKLGPVASTQGGNVITSKKSMSNPLYVTPSEDYHIVKRGDNLFQISKASGIPLNKLKLYNNLVEDDIFLGQKIYLKPNMTVFPKYITRVDIPEQKYHTVASGQILADISHMYGVFVLDLVDFNGLSSLEIKQGEKIWLVDGKMESGLSGKKITVNTPRRKEVKYGKIESESNLPEKKVIASTPRRIKVKAVPKSNKLNRAVKLPTTAKGGKVILAQKSAISTPKRVKSSIGKTISQAKPQHTGLEFPVKGGRIISNFGTQGFTINKGVNIAGEDGEPVKAVLAGKVIFAGEQRGYGNVIVLEHDKFVMTVYAHNKANLVRSGDTVTASQPIAKLGQSGRVDTPQLHFEYRVKGKAVDPRKVLSQI